MAWAVALAPAPPLADACAIACAAALALPLDTAWAMAEAEAEEPPLAFWSRERPAGRREGGSGKGQQRRKEKPLILDATGQDSCNEWGEGRYALFQFGAKL